MKNFTHLMKAVFAFALMFSFSGLFAQTYTLTDDDVVVEGGVITSCGYSFVLTDIIIPQTLDGQTVTGIADGSTHWLGVFYNKGITSVELPAALKKIGDYAFYDNDIASLDLSVCTGIDTIGKSAFFSNSNLMSLNLSGCSSLISIGDNAFENNSISNLDFSDCTALISIGDRAYSGNDLTSLDLSNCTALISIGAYAFSSNAIASLNFSGSTALNSIGAYAFSGNSISVLDFSTCTALASIGEYAFLSNAIGTLNLSSCTGLRYLGSSAFSGNLLTEFALPEVIYDGTVYNTWVDREANSYTAGVDMATNITSFYVPLITYTLTDDDVEVEEGVITSCSYDFELKSIIIPQSLDGQTVIAIEDGFLGTGIFYNKGIIQVELPSTIQTIGSYAFNTNELTSIDLSGYTALTSIGNRSFSDNAITAVNLSGCTALISFGTYAFSSNDITSLNLSGCTALTSIDMHAFFLNDLTNLDLSSCTALANIGDFAFSYNTFSSINLIGCTDLRYIGIQAFWDNPSVLTFTLPEVIHDGTVYSSWIDGEANSYTAGVDMATNLETFYVPFITYTLTDDDVEVEEGLITSCSYDFEFKNIIIPETLDGQTVIGIADESSSYWGVFYSKGITSVELPSTIQIIGDYAFSQNEIVSLDLSVCTGIDTIGKQAFYENNNLSGLDLSGCTSLTLIDASAFYNTAITALDLSDCSALISIGESAFRGNDIAALDLSACTSLKTIGEMAFLFNSISTLNLTGCSNLRLIGYRAFAVTPLTEFALPEVTYGGTVYNTWVDREANSYTAGVDLATNLETFYVPFIPYTLTDDDVEVEEGEIISCSYDFELKYIIIPQTLDGQTVIGIADKQYYHSGIFYNKGIILVEFPLTIQTIGAYAFYEDEISSLDLSACTALSSIGEFAFTHNVMTTIDVTGCTALSSIGESAFSYNDIIALDVSDCSALTDMGEHAFSYNDITTLDLSSCTALANIGDYAFYMNIFSSLNLTGCTGLRYVGIRAFYEYSSALTFDLPEVMYEGTLYDIWIDEEANSYTAGTDLATDLETFYVPMIPYTLTDDDVEILKGVITSCTYDFELKNIIIPEILDGETVVGIADGRYADQGIFNFRGITSLVLPATIQDIGDNAFINNKLNSLDLSACPDIASFGERAFSSNSIVSLDLSGTSSLLSIGEEAFRYNELTDFYLPDPVVADYFYSKWEDSDGGIHTGGDLINNLILAYNRVMPEITLIDPVFAPTAGNLEVTFKGINFETEKYNKSLLFDGTEATAYTFWNDTMITAVCPPNPEGPAKIEMVLENDLSYYSTKQFYYSDDDIVPVCGIVSGIWETGKTYLLTCNVNIPEDSTLIIEEGVRILAMPDEQITFSCAGVLQVMGTEAYPVSFGSTTEVPGSWEGIKIYGTYLDCAFRYCILEFATTAVSLTGWAYGCDSEDNYSLFENCIVRNNTNEGFYCRGEGDFMFGCSWPRTGVCSPTIKNCQIYNNGGEGIKLYAYDGYYSNGYVGAAIYNTQIYANKNGIVSSGSDPVEPKIVSNVIADNIQAAISNNQNDFDSEDYILANNIFLNNETGIANEDTITIVLYNNGFWSNAVDLQGDLADSANIFLDPMFVDAGIQDYNLTAGSPCIDAGNNSFVASDYDYYNRARIWDGNNDQEYIIDMGIAEFGAGCYLINETVSICEGDSVQVGDSVFTETGSYTVELSDQFGCDSIVHLDLTVITVNTAVTQSGDTLTAELSGAGYRWLDCDNNYTLISGGYYQSYVATIDGNYSVEVSFGGCKDTSDCFLVDVEESAVPGMNDFGSSSLVYPNPTNQHVTIELGASYGEVRLRVFNATGQQISDLEYGTADLIQYEIEGEPGHYIFRVNTKEGKSATFNIVKN